jgi:hypothetical protein
VGLPPVCPIVVAPSFHLPGDWRQRIAVQARSGFLPPEDRELDILAPVALVPSASQNLEVCLCLFRLPQHLCSAWWQLVAQSGASVQGHLPGFDKFAGDVAEFLAFKEMAVPTGAAFELLVSTPGLQSISCRAAHPALADSLAQDVPAANDDATLGSQLWGGINLGEEPSLLVFTNSQAPAVRFKMEPGEGFRLPVAGMLVDGCTMDKTELDVLLLIRHRLPAGGGAF